MYACLNAHRRAGRRTKPTSPSNLLLAGSNASTMLCVISHLYLQAPDFWIDSMDDHRFIKHIRDMEDVEKYIIFLQLHLEYLPPIPGKREMYKQLQNMSSLMKECSKTTCRKLHDTKYKMCPNLSAIATRKFLYACGHSKEI